MHFNDRTNYNTPETEQSVNSNAMPLPPDSYENEILEEALETTDMGNAERIRDMITRRCWVIGRNEVVPAGMERELRGGGYVRVSEGGARRWW